MTSDTSAQDTWPTQLTPESPATTTGNAASPLLRLPFELRERIWEFLFPEDTIHLTRRRDGALRASVCAIAGYASHWGFCCWERALGQALPHEVKRQKRASTRMQDYYALATLCKLTRHEASTRFFAATTLALFRLENAIALHDIIKTPYLPSLQSLTFVWTRHNPDEPLPPGLPVPAPPAVNDLRKLDAACAAIARRLTALTRVVMHFHDGRPGPDKYQDSAEAEPPWAESLRRLAHCPRLELVCWGVPERFLPRPDVVPCRVLVVAGDPDSAAGVVIVELSAAE